jgi:IstB-like ATP binding protein
MRPGGSVESWRGLKKRVIQHQGGNLFFQLVNARYEKGVMILTSNRGFAEWGEIFADPVVVTALLDRLLRRRRLPDRRLELSATRARRSAARADPDKTQPAPIPPTLRRRGRPPKNGGVDLPAADPQTRRSGEFYFGASGENTIGIYYIDARKIADGRGEAFAQGAEVWERAGVKVLLEETGEFGLAGLLMSEGEKPPP